MNVDKTRGKRIFEIVLWPFKLPPNKYKPAGQAVRLDLLVHVSSALKKTI